MGFRGSNGTSHKVKRKKSNWKSKYLSQRGQDSNNPDLKAHKYICLSGHIRIEKKKLDGDTVCQACINEGKKHIFRYVGGYTIPRSQAKKSRF